MNYDEDVKLRFANIGPANPLKKLTSVEKGRLVGMLYLYLETEESMEKVGIKLEEVAQIACQARQLSVRMQAAVFEGKLAPALAPFVWRFQELPALLGVFESEIGSLLDITGTPGHRGKVLRNQLLVLASEYVRKKTGRNNDEHLAELLQTVETCTDDISGDSIRKKREHMKTSYPQVYENLLDLLKRTD